KLRDSFRGVGVISVNESPVARPAPLLLPCHATNMVARATTGITMKLHELSFLCGLALLAGLMPASAASDDLPALFGTRVSAASRFPGPVATGDFDGDGLPDRVYLVKIAPASPSAALAADVVVNWKAFGTKPLGNHGEELAIAIVQGNGKVKTLLTDYN